MEISLGLLYSLQNATFRRITGALSGDAMTWQLNVTVSER